MQLKFTYCFIILFVLCTIRSVAQKTADDLYLYDNLAPVTEANAFKTPGYYNWCPSIIKTPDGVYHLFYSRWKKEYSYEGWLTHSEIAHATAKSPLGPWKFKEVALRGRGDGHWDAITAHNPKIKYFEGKYYLYYISTNLKDKSFTTEADLLEASNKPHTTHANRGILRAQQRTGVAVANSINGPWVRSNKPLIEPSGPITTLTVNPAIDRGADGKYYLIVKGDKPNEKRFIRNQAVAVANHPEGPFVMQLKPVIDYLDTEDMSIWYNKLRKRFYGVFHSTTGFIGMLTSNNGIDWEKATDYVLMLKSILKADGTILKPDRLERPFMFIENDKPAVLALSVKQGDEAYNIFIPVVDNKFPKPNKRQLAWQEAELGAIFHYDLNVFDNKQYNQAENRITPIPNYQVFNPGKLNTDQWVKVAKAAGVKFALITATHETGFALYPSNVNPYCLRALNWREGKGDIVGDFISSCKKYDIKPGIYLGIRWNSFLGVHNFKVQGEGAFQKNRQDAYNRMVEGMVKELCTRYGELFEFWFDGGADHPNNGAPDVLPIIRQYQPNCLFYHNGQLAEARWGGSETGTVAYPNWSSFPYRQVSYGKEITEAVQKNNYELLKKGDAGGQFWLPAMADAPLRGYKGRHEWLWEPGDEAHIFPVKELMEMYEKSVGRNATLIIGLTPNPDGLLPDADVQRLKEWGDALKQRFAAPLGTSSGKGNEFDIRFETPKEINQVVIQEDIRQNGEAVKKFVVEGFEGGKWIQLATGESVGHKMIQRFGKVSVERVRLRIIESVRPPLIKSFSVSIF